MQAQQQDLTTSIGLLILRLGVGGYLMAHGWGKLQWVVHGQFDRLGDPIGLGPGLSLVLIMSAEFFCSLLVVLGLATRFAAVPVIFGLGVAAFVVHGGDPWMMTGGRAKEPALLYLLPFLALIFTGAGRFSLDALLWPKLRARRAQN